MSETVDFFGRLLASVPEDLWVYLWTLEDRKSHWMPVSEGADALAAKAVELGAETDVYFGVSAAKKPIGRIEHQRISATNSAGIFGLWADIDIAEPGVHKNVNLPPSETDAMTLLEEAGAKPSILIHSGHGLQAWWLWGEFWEFSSEEDRKNAADLARRWNSTLRVRAGQHGWIVDSVFDLSRVMRVPGTFNFKGEIPVLVGIRSNEPTLSWSPDSLNGFLLDDSQIPAQVATGRYLWDSSCPNGKPERDPDADAPEELSLMLRLDDVLEKTWKRQRKDMKDQSLSSYDMSMATRLATAGMVDQKIVNSIISFRRSHGATKEERTKALRLDYLERTIARARADAASEGLTEVLQEIPDKIKEAESEGDPDRIRETTRDADESISRALLPDGVHAHWIKFESNPPTYALELTTRIEVIHFGESSIIFNQNQCRMVVFDRFGTSFRRFRNTEWDQIVAAIGATAEHRSVGEEATERGQMRMWIEGFLDDYPPTEAEETDQTHHPIRGQDGQIRIVLDKFKDWLYYSQRTTPPERGSKTLATRLRSYGAVPSTIRVRLASGAVRADHPCWILPQEGSA